MQRRTSLILSLLLPVQIIALQILKHFPQFVETYYSQTLYPLISTISRYILGWIPFSVGDLFYLVIAILAIRWFYKNFYRLKREPLGFFLDILASVSIVYFLFHALWGFNYYRLPLHQSLGLRHDYTYDQLLLTTEKFVKKSNDLHRRLGYKDSIKIELPYSQKQLMEMSSNGYKSLKNEFPQLQYEPKSIKKSSWSLGLTYMGYSGYLNPFTGEAQVNRLIQTYKFPVVVCHEEAHQIGFAAENEANFVATLATLNNDDPYIQYAGSIFALRFLINEIAKNDIKRFYEILKTINPGILKAYEEQRQFWEQYENPLEDFSKIFWDNFLKANNQSHGIESYNYMVALVVNYYLNQEI